MIRRGGAVTAGRLDQGPGLGRQPPGVGGQMKFRVSGQERAYLLFIFCRFGGAGDIEEAAAGFQEPGGRLQHGLLPGRERGQVAFPEPALDLRVTPDDAQGGARDVQDHGVQGARFSGGEPGRRQPGGVSRRHAPAPRIELQFLEAAGVAVHRHQQAGVAHGLGQVGGLTSPAGADLHQAQVRPQGKQTGSQLRPFILEDPEALPIRRQVRGEDLKASNMRPTGENRQGRDSTPSAANRAMRAAGSVFRVLTRTVSGGI